ncbi:TniB family NTP-binding protein [Mesorhizobium australicum]
MATAAWGRTMIMKRFGDQRPPSFNSVTGKLRTPVLAMEMTSRPGERRFLWRAAHLARGTAAAARRYCPMDQAALLRIMGATCVQVLMIDEVHNILTGRYHLSRAADCPQYPALSKQPPSDFSRLLWG